MQMGYVVLGKNNGHGRDNDLVCARRNEQRGAGVNDVCCLPPLHLKAGSLLALAFEIRLSFYKKK